MDRFTISLDDKLATEFNAWIAERGYQNRSEAVRDLIRSELEVSRLQRGTSTHCIACLSYVFNHHELDLAERITSLQHEHHELTVSTMHAHLDHDHCLETVILKGATGEVQHFAATVCAQRGVHHGKVNLISMEVHQPHRHGGGIGHAPGEHQGQGAAHVHLKPST
jgi:CopG family nickel-responsive transcriptional regulator